VKTTIVREKEYGLSDEGAHTYD